MRLVAAAPEIPWSDLSYSLVPTGRTLDYANGDGYGPRVGVEKASFVSGLYALGSASGTYAPPGVMPSADLSTWYALIDAGEPYDSNPAARAIVDEIQQHHSSFFVDHSQPPAPLLIANGTTDDLFPVDEAVRFRNRTKAEYPGAYVSLFDLDYGHQRGRNLAADTNRLNARQQTFFDFFLRGEGARPAERRS